MWGDQIITATNSMRSRINGQVRGLLGRGAEPEEGDKIICLRNYWEDINACGDPLVNGTVGTLTNSFRQQVNLPHRIAYNSGVKSFDVIIGDFIANDSIYPCVDIDRQMLLTGEKCCDWRLSYQLGRMRRYVGDIVPKEFAYGYAITCHKAQGSEWDKILVFEENFPFQKEEHSRWLYTAITRASEKVVIIRS